MYILSLVSWYVTAQHSQVHMVQWSLIILCPEAHSETTALWKQLRLQQKYAYCASALWSEKIYVSIAETVRFEIT